MSDIEDLLRRSAVVPTRQLDAGAIATAADRRAGRRRSTVLAASALVAVTAVAALLFVAPEPHMVFAPQPMLPQPAASMEPATPIPAAPSQSEADAARDGVDPDLARLTFGERVSPLTRDNPGQVTRITTEGGVWLVSVWSLDALNIFSKDRACPQVAPDSRIVPFCDVWYGEILLLDPTETRIVRAFPMPAFWPRTIALTGGSLYCARGGTPGAAGSMLCRIDLRSMTMQVRTFRDDAATADLAQYVPTAWTQDESPAVVKPDVLAVSSDGVVSVSSADLPENGSVTTGAPNPVRAVVDPESLELAAEQPALGERVARAFVEYAAAPALVWGPLAFTGEVSLGLGSGVVRVQPAEALGDPDLWRIEANGAFGRSGTISALDLVAAQPPESLVIASGPHPQCAGPPIDPPTELRGLTMVSIQPRQPDSCIDWFAIDLFLDGDGRVTGVTVDLWEP